MDETVAQFGGDDEGMVGQIWLFAGFVFSGAKLAPSFAVRRAESTECRSMFLVATGP